MRRAEDWRNLALDEIVENVAIVASILRDKFVEAKAKGAVLDERRVLTRLLRISIDLQKLVADRLRYTRGGL